MTKKVNGKAVMVVERNNDQANEAQTNGAPKTILTEVKEENPQVLELSARIAELEAKLKKASIPKNIEDAIWYFEEKKRKINQLTAFETVGEELFQAKTEVENVNDPNDINVKLFKLSLTKHNEYREGEKLLSVTNNPVILRAIDFLMEEVAKKVETLKEEIRG